MVDIIKHTRINITNLPTFFEPQHNTSDRKFEPGRLIRVYNPRINGVLVGMYDCDLRYVVNRNGSAMAAGELAAFMRAQAVTADSGSTSTLVDATEFVANEAEGRMILITDDAGGAGAAPEGESAIIFKNTATTVYFEPDLTVAVAAGDTAALLTRHDIVDAADGDFQVEVAGVVPGTLTDNYYGWVVARGWVRGVGIKASTGLTASEAIVADAALVNDGNGDGSGLWVGYTEVAVASDVVGDKALLFIDTIGGGRSASA